HGDRAIHGPLEHLHLGLDILVTNEGVLPGQRLQLRHSVGGQLLPGENLAGELGQRRERVVDRARVEPAERASDLRLGHDPPPLHFVLWGAATVGVAHGLPLHGPVAARLAGLRAVGGAALLGVGPELRAHHASPETTTSRRALGCPPARSSPRPTQGRRPPVATDLRTYGTGPIVAQRSDMDQAGSRLIAARRGMSIGAG